jgi:hypothetical protein
MLKLLESIFYKKKKKLFLLNLTKVYNKYIWSARGRDSERNFNIKFIF